MAGLNPKASRQEAMTWGHWLELVRRVYHEADFDLTVSWTAQLDSKRENAWHKVIERAAKDPSMQHYPGLRNVDLIMFRMGRTHYTLIDYVKKLTKEGRLNQEDFEKDEQSTSKAHKFDTWTMERVRSRGLQLEPKGRVGRYKVPRSEPSP